MTKKNVETTTQDFMIEYDFNALQRKFWSKIRNSTVTCPQEKNDNAFDFKGIS
jgi:hypothetical protein